MQVRDNSWIVLLLVFSLLMCSSAPSPGPGPGPNPQTETLASLAILIVEDSSQRTPEQAILLTDPEFRTWARQSAARVYVVDSTGVQADGSPSPLLDPWRTWAAGSSSGGNPSATLPALLLVRSDGSVYQAARLPGSSAGVKAWITARTK